MLNKLLSAMVLVLAMLTASTSQARSPNPQVIQSLAILKQSIGQKVAVQWSKDGRFIREIEVDSSAYPKNRPLPSLSTPEEITGSPEHIATEFLKKHSSLLEIPPDLAGLEVLTVDDLNIEGYEVKFKQRINGVAVDNELISSIVVRVLLKDTRTELKGVRSVSSGYLHHHEVPQPSISEQDAVEIAKQYILQLPTKYAHEKLGFDFIIEHTTFINELNKVLLYIDTERKNFPVIYEVRFISAAAIYIDAYSGEILGTLPPVDMYYEGKGDVFWPNPVNYFYNSAFASNPPFVFEDQNDTDINNLLPAYVRQKVLHDIAYDEIFKAYALCGGPRVCLDDMKQWPFYFGRTVFYSGAAISFDAQGNFASPNNRFSDAFEHVMVYDVIDTNQRYVESLLGVSRPRKIPIKVDPHVGELIPGTNPPQYKEIDQSRYSALDDYLYFGEGGVDDAEDADVILHEYGHVLQDAVAPRLYAFPIPNTCTMEAGAMSEGFSDYWQASNTYAITVEHKFTEGPACYAEWDYAGGASKIPGQICKRRVDSTKKYPTDFLTGGDCHINGEIWSSALWGIFNRLGNKLQNKQAGKIAADSLILKSHVYVRNMYLDSKGKRKKPGYPTFKEGGIALLQADKYFVNNWSKASAKTEICAALKARGIKVTGPTIALTCS